MTCSPLKPTVYGNTSERLNYELRDVDGDLVTLTSGTLTITRKNGDVLISAVAASGSGTTRLYWTPAWGATPNTQIPPGTEGELIVKWTAVHAGGTYEADARTWLIVAR